MGSVDGRQRQRRLANAARSYHGCQATALYT
jgi:hypothetical protein